MSLWAYFYQLRASFRKFLNTKETIAANKERTQDELKVRNEIMCYLHQQCEKSAQEVQYIGCFTHWPIARPKTKLQKPSLVYLDVNRSKLASVEQRSKRRNIIAETAKSTSFIRRVGTVKKYLVANDKETLVHYRLKISV